MDENERIQQLADEAYNWFEQDERDDDTKFTKLKYEAPEWMLELVREAHGEFFPEDWRYEEIQGACARIHDADDVDESGYDIEADVYTMDRLRWLASHLDRVDYCDDAMKEFGKESFDSVVEIIGAGQIREREEIHQSVLQSLRNRLEEIGDESDEEEETE